MDRNENLVDAGSPFCGGEDSLVTKIRLKRSEFIRYSLFEDREIALTHDFLGWRIKGFWPRPFEAVHLRDVRARITRQRYRFWKIFHLEVLAIEDGRVLFKFAPQHPGRWLSALSRCGVAIDDDWMLVNRRLYASWVNAQSIVTLTRIVAVLILAWIAHGGDAWAVGIFTAMVFAFVAVWWAAFD